MRNALEILNYEKIGRREIKPMYNSIHIEGKRGNPGKFWSVMKTFLSFL